MRANLEYRETQKQIRQKALLESASLPPRMQQLQKSENELKKILKSAKNKVKYCWDQKTGLVQYVSVGRNNVECSYETVARQTHCRKTDVHNKVLLLLQQLEVIVSPYSHY